MAKLKYTLEIDLDDLSDDERQSLADMVSVDPSKLGGVHDVDQVEVADMIASWLLHSGDEFWAGSDMYAKITDVSVTPA